MEMVSVDAASDSTGDSGGVGGGDLRAGIAKGDVEVSQGGQRGEDGPIERYKLRGNRRIGGKDIEPLGGRHKGEGWMEAFGGENGRGMAGEQQEQFVEHRSE